MSSERHAFHLSIGSQFENIDLVQTVLDESLTALGLDDDTRHWVDLAVREAVANAIKHGNAQDPDKQVRVWFGVETEGPEGERADDRVEGERTIVIRVRDEGEGFDPGGVADPLAQENLMRPGGRGFLYMNNFMDAIDVRPHPEGGTEVTLRKRIPAPDRAETQQTQEKDS